ncbi:PTS lactose/cellobiose transporter subunit IIA [Sharpea azabuensis]|uniref:PTS lactose/cellobiose transporter subunit IIA n=1 Tax=Sharpea azabuensis TaxID=322505 RepID=UPI0024094535|nr:PTS lactose/cellobiose transporter subunit IIA [Sharpea azabuensis]MDD6512304.1 PTS lactose/cellobiose transporter subunit IIA [Sharpea azabuensis]
MEEENKTEEQSIEMTSFQIIANAGDARSYAFQALEAAREGRFDEADELMKKSEDASVLAHKAQTNLLFNEMNGKPTPVNVLLVHSQDHLMTSMLAQELIKELILMYRNK